MPAATSGSASAPAREIISPHQAMANRRPVVSTRVGKPMGRIADGAGGHPVGVGLIERLAEVLQLPESARRRRSDMAHEIVKESSRDGAAVLVGRDLEAVIERPGRTARTDQPAADGPDHDDSPSLAGSDRP